MKALIARYCQASAITRVSWMCSTLVDVTEPRDAYRLNPEEADPNLLDPNDVPVLEIGGGLGVIGQGMQDDWTRAQINVGSRIDVVDEPDLEIDLELLIVFDRDEGRFICQEMTGRRRSGGPEVTQTRLRPARIAEYIRGVVPGLLVYMDERGRWQRFESFESLVPAVVRNEAAHHGPTSETLKWAARLYRAAEVINAHPIKAVTEQLGLSTRTAHNWISKARSEGLLESAPDLAMKANEPSAMSGDQRGEARGPRVEYYSRSAEMPMESSD